MYGFLPPTYVRSSSEVVTEEMQDTGTQMGGTGAAAQEQQLFNPMHSGLQFATDINLNSEYGSTFSAVVSAALGSLPLGLGVLPADNIVLGHISIPPAPSTPPPRGYDVIAMSPPPAVPAVTTSTTTSTPETATPQTINEAINDLWSHEDIERAPTQHDVGIVVDPDASHLIPDMRISLFIDERRRGLFGLDTFINTSTMHYPLSLDTLNGFIHQDSRGRKCINCRISARIIEGNMVLFITVLPNEESQTVSDLAQYVARNHTTIREQCSPGFDPIGLVGIAEGWPLFFTVSWVGDNKVCNIYKFATQTTKLPGTQEITYDTWMKDGTRYYGGVTRAQRHVTPGMYPVITSVPIDSWRCLFYRNELTRV